MPARKSKKRPYTTPRWVPTVDGRPVLEYGLWQTRVQAERAAAEAAMIRCTFNYGSARVYYRVDEHQ